MHGERDEDAGAPELVGTADAETHADARPKHGGRRPGAGRKTQHGLRRLRGAVTQLTTKQLDGRSRVAVAVRGWKADVRRDLGGDLSRAQETILEAAAQSWVILSSIDDFIARQPSLITRKRALLPVVRERMQIAEGLAKHLERLGLERRAKDVDVATMFARLHDAKATGGGGGGETDGD